MIINPLLSTIMKNIRGNRLGVKAVGNMYEQPIKRAIIEALNKGGILVYYESMNVTIVLCMNEKRGWTFVKNVIT